MNSILRASLFLYAAILFTACGADSHSKYVPTTDTITTTAGITIDAMQDVIRVTQKGQEVSSEIVEDCTVGVDADEIPYQLKDESDLLLAEQPFTWVRPLSDGTAAGGIFGVWKGETFTKGLVSYTFEVEIHTDQMIYRNTCSR